MQRTLLLFGITAVCLACGATSQPPPASGSNEPDFSGERLKAHVTFLADDLLEGREAGRPGHEIAAR